jgi:hypothetical protein
MKTPATCSRVMQFEGGPQRTRFYACDGHYDSLHVPSMCHFPIFTEPVRNEDPEEEINCDFCREGGQG